MLQWIADLLRRVFKDTRPPFNPGIDPFPTLDMDRVRRQLQPVERGRSAGQSDLPRTDAELPDANEREIEAFFAGLATTSARIVEDRLKAYTQSMQAQGTTSLQADVEQIRSTAVGNLRVLKLDGANKLHELADRARQLSADLIDFRKEHGLRRAAVYPDSKWLLWGVLAVFVVIETVVNGSMFARGNEFGLLGGGIWAVVFSLANVALIGFVGGRWLLPLIYDRSGARRAIGTLGLVLFLTAVIAFNLAIGHFRAALSDAGQASATAAVRALETLRASPTGLKDLLDWFLVVAGMAFCLFASWDWFKMDDPYPGYGDIDRLAKQGRQAYAEEVGIVYDDAGRIRDEALRGLTAASRHWEIATQERALAYGRSQQLLAQMERHRDYLQTCLRTLISEYRAANIAVRKTEPPTYFTGQPALSGGSSDLLPAPLAGSPEPVSVTQAQAEVTAGYSDAIQHFDTVRALAEKETNVGS